MKILLTAALLISSTAFAQQQSYNWIQQQQIMQMQQNMAQQNMAAQRQLMMEQESRQRVRDSQDGLNRAIQDISRPDPTYQLRPY